MLFCVGHSALPFPDAISCTCYQCLLLSCTSLGVLTERERRSEIGNGLKRSSDQSEATSKNKAPPSPVVAKAAHLAIVGAVHQAIAEAAHLAIEEAVHPAIEEAVLEGAVLRAIEEAVLEEAVLLALEEAVLLAIEEAVLLAIEEEAHPMTTQNLENLTKATTPPHLRLQRPYKRRSRKI